VSSHHSAAAPKKQKRLTAPDIHARKGAEPVVCLTAYTTPMARLLDPHTDLLLVGDSLGMVLHGLETTLGVTLEMMILHGQAVMRGSRRSLVVVDMPFGTYEGAKETAFENCARVMREVGCGAVKLEGGERMAETIEYLTKRGIPVMGHIGLTPQAVQSDGGFKTKGRCEEDWAPIEADARAVAEAGAFSVVLEGMAEPLAKRITQSIAIPTVGIGASAACDGQILVSEDMLGFNEKVPRFVKRYAEVGHTIEDAAKAYAEAVRGRSFPEAVHTYGMKESTKLKKAVG